MFNKATKLTMRTHGKLVRNHVSLFLNTRPHGFGFFSMISETFDSLRIFLDSPLDTSKVSFAHSWCFDDLHFTETRIEDQSHWTTLGDDTLVNAIRSQISATLQQLFFLFLNFFICFPNCILNKNKKFVEQAPSTRAKWVQTRNILLSCVFEKKKTFNEAFHVWSPSAVQLECGEIFILLLFSYPTSEGDVWKIF